MASLIRKFPITTVTSLVVIPIDVVNTFVYPVPEECNKTRYYMGRLLTAPLAPVLYASGAATIGFGSLIGLLSAARSVAIGDKLVFLTPSEKLED